MKKKKLLVAALSIPIALGGQQAYADAQTTSNATQEASKLEVQVKFDRSTGSFVTTNKDSAKPQTAITTPKAEKKDAAEQQTAPQTETNSQTNEKASTQSEQSSKPEEKVVLKVKDINVKVGEKADPRSAFENLPTDAKAEFVGTVDTSTADTKTAKIKVTFADSTVQEVEVTVNVNKPEEKTQGQDKATDMQLSDELTQDSVGQGNTQRETYKQTFNVSIGLTGLNDGEKEFDKAALPETIEATLYHKKGGVITSEQTISISTSTLTIQGSKLVGTVEINLPVDMKQEPLHLEFKPIDLVKHQSDSTTGVNEKDGTMTIGGDVMQITNPKIKVDVQNPYGRPEDRKDGEDLKGTLNLKGEEENEEGYKKIDFKVKSGEKEADVTQTDAYTNEDNPKYFDDFVLNYPGDAPSITIEGETEEEDAANPSKKIRL